jgi:predicted RNase H-like HicB family nuclease
MEKNSHACYTFFMFTAVFKKTGKMFSAWVEEVPGVNTQGATKKDAEANLRDALNEYVLARRSVTQKTVRAFTRKQITAI